ncbi:unnamed protein product [Wuchereria bancrofti]|uniref:Uncharacterized protein n=1 Tax=Wuchereria bancrofti TaxID=6293 RepID=A0A3P7DQG8_WUCBA|nr:unnamed protein product [Wuchereria bancrofti]
MVKGEEYPSKGVSCYTFAATSASVTVLYKGMSKPKVLLSDEVNITSVLLEKPTKKSTAFLDGLTGNIKKKECKTREVMGNGLLKEANILKVSPVEAKIKRKESSVMITVKNIYGLPTERHERGIYKVVYDEDERPVLDKQLICKPNKELTTALEPISRQAEEFEELMSVEAFEKKGEKNGINFDIVMQLETGEEKLELFQEKKHPPQLQKEQYRLSMEGNSKKKKRCITHKIFNELSIFPRISQMQMYKLEDNETRLPSIHPEVGDYATKDTEITVEGKAQAHHEPGRTRICIKEEMPTNRRAEGDGSFVINEALDVVAEESSNYA